MEQWGITFMIPFTITLIVLIGGAFLTVVYQEQVRQEKMLLDNAENLADGVLSARTVFAKNQDRINYDSKGNYEFKFLNPVAGAALYIDEINELSDVKIKQTSDLNRNPDAKPDPWEEKALQAFKEDPQLERYYGKVPGSESTFNYAVPLRIDESCLKCHGEPAGELDITGFAKEGYKVGDLRGIVSIKIPLEEYQVNGQERVISFGVITLIILILTWLMGQRMVKSLQRVANTDRLTKLNNRNVFYTQFAHQVKIAEKRGTPLALLIFDIDHFKKINDQYGHLAGDMVLAELAHLTKGLIRKTDVLARFGGEEFILIAPNTGAMGAYKLGERIRSAVESHIFQYEGQIIPVTISVGIVVNTEISDEMQKLQEELIKGADEALYLAKSNGRNRVEIFNKME